MVVMFIFVVLLSAMALTSLILGIELLNRKRKELKSE